jgi:hypothetical protein
MRELIRPMVGLILHLSASQLARTRPRIPSRVEQIEKRLAELDTIEKEMCREEEGRPVFPMPVPEDVSVGCVPCARAHLSTVAGSLKEALRFAREEGIMHPEVQSRLQTAEEDITAVERHDWTPEKILRSPPEEQEVIRRFLPRLRALRQGVMTVASVEDLEQVAAEAGKLATDFRLEVLRLRGVDVGQIVELARKVEAGEITMEEAKKIVARTGG